jgi:hypothetical protein
MVDELSDIIAAASLSMPLERLQHALKKALRGKIEGYFAH